MLSRIRTCTCLYKCQGFKHFSAFYYIFYTCADVSLKALSNALTFVWRWYPLGIQFGIPDADLRKIECDYQRTDDRMLHMISKWLRIDEQPSWLKVVRALVAINERHVARNIAEKYGIL